MKNETAIRQTIAILEDLGKTEGVKVLKWVLEDGPAKKTGACRGTGRRPGRGPVSRSCGAHPCGIGGVQLRAACGIDRDAGDLWQGYGAAAGPRFPPPEPAPPDLGALILVGQTPVPVACAPYTAEGVARLLEWAQWLEAADRVVFQTMLLGMVWVSTVFLGLDHNLQAPTRSRLCRRCYLKPWPSGATLSAAAAGRSAARPGSKAKPSIAPRGARSSSRAPGRPAGPGMVCLLGGCRRVQAVRLARVVRHSRGCPMSLPQSEPALPRRRPPP